MKRFQDDDFDSAKEEGRRSVNYKAKVKRKREAAVLKAKTPTVLNSIAGVPDDEAERTRNRKRQARRYRRSGRVGTMLTDESELG